MRTSILDEVRKVIEANKSDIDSADGMHIIHSALKKAIEGQYNGKWQIVIGKDIDVYFDESIINEYMTLRTEIKTMIIFRKRTDDGNSPVKQEK
jgi:signal recognition particle receptor subunit beta